MKRLRFLLPCSLLPCWLVVSSPAYADMAPWPGLHRVTYTYEIANLAAYDGYVFVAWPRVCSSGKPLGEINFVDPKQTDSHKQDYEILTPPYAHQIGKFCDHTTRVYALPKTAFSTVIQPAPENDWSLDQKKGTPVVRSPELDALSWRERVPFFRTDPRVVRSPRAFEPLREDRDERRVQRVHDILVIRSFGQGTMELIPDKVRYTFDDGRQREVFYGLGTQRPEPPHLGALASVPDPIPAPTNPPASLATAEALTLPGWKTWGVVATLLGAGGAAWAWKGRLRR